MPNMSNVSDDERRAMIHLEAVKIQSKMSDIINRIDVIPASNLSALETILTKIRAQLT
mgnify:CR=1 FL=1